METAVARDHATDPNTDDVKSNTESSAMLFGAAEEHILHLDDDMLDGVGGRRNINTHPHDESCDSSNFEQAGAKQNNIQRILYKDHQYCIPTLRSAPLFTHECY